MFSIRTIWWRIADLPLMIGLWLVEPEPETEADRITRCRSRAAWGGSFRFIDIGDRRNRQIGGLQCL